MSCSLDSHALGFTKSSHACYTPVTLSSRKCIVTTTEHLPRGTTLDSECAVKYPRVGILAVIRTQLRNRKINQMSYFSFASNSRAQPTAELISYLLNKNRGDSFKISNQPNGAPRTMGKPKHNLGCRHGGGPQPSMKSRNDIAGTISAILLGFKLFQLLCFLSSPFGKFTHLF